MLNTKKGISIYLAVMIMAIMLAIVLGSIAILLGQMKIIRGMGDSIIALYAADTGIEHALYNIRQEDGDGDVSGFLDAPDNKIGYVVNSEKGVAVYEGEPSSACEDLFEYNGNVYAAISGTGKIIVSSDGIDWTEVYSLPGNKNFYSLGEFNGQLFAGAEKGEIYNCADPGLDGICRESEGEWGQIYDLPGNSDSAQVLLEYQNRLYVGLRDNDYSGGAELYVCDGAVCLPSLDADWHAYSLKEYNGKLYAGTGGFGYLYECTDLGGNGCFAIEGDWSLVDDFSGFNVTVVNDLAVYKNRLYAGTGGGAGDKYIFVYGPADESFSANEQFISLVEHLGRLYTSTGLGNIYRCDPGIDDVCLEDPDDEWEFFANIPGFTPIIISYKGVLLAGTVFRATIWNPEVTRVQSKGTYQEVSRAIEVQFKE